MANPLKGEVELTAGDRVYVLRYSIDAICALEQATGKGLPMLVAQMSHAPSVTVTLARAILHAGLIENYPEMTAKEAGELIPTFGGVVKIMAKVNEAFKVAFPKAEASGTPRPPAQPNRQQRRAAGSGKNSTKNGSRST